MKESIEFAKLNKLDVNSRPYLSV